MPDLISDLLSELSELISSDDSIPQQKRDEFLALAQENTLADFLSSVFLYALKKPNKLPSDKRLIRHDGTSTVLDDVEKLKTLLNNFYQLHPTP